MRRILLLLALLALPTAVDAQQLFESVGSRAMGMGGAFVAVADDATAVYWNPAGLATAGPIGATVGWVRLRSRDQKAPPAAGAGARTSHFTSLGTWPLGLAYGNVETVRLLAGPDDTMLAERLKISLFGVSILQTVTPGLVVGGTFKILRGTVASGAVGGETTRAALDLGADLDGKTRTRVDLDLSVMANLGRARVGLTTRNVRTPAFDNGAGVEIELQRQTRLGVAAFPVDGLTLAMDVDLNTADLRDGLRRMIAFGGESRLGGHLAVRGGVRWNLKGVRVLTFSTGASYSLKRGVWLDVHYTQGHIDGDRGYGLALRAGM